MTQNRASSPLRVIQLAGISSPNGNSLISLNTAKLPNGALAMVNTTLFRLDKESGLSPDGSSVVAALGGGNWLALGGDGGSLYSFQLRLVALTAPITDPLSNTWSAFSTNPNRFGSVGSTAFSANTTTGVVTYSGPTRSFAVTGTLSAVPNSNLAAVYEFSMSRTGAVLIGTQDDPVASALAHYAAGGVGIEYDNLTFADLVTLQNGDQVQGCIRNPSTVTGMSLIRYGLLFTPAG